MNLVKQKSFRIRRKTVEIFLKRLSSCLKVRVESWKNNDGPFPFICGRRKSHLPNFLDFSFVPTYRPSCPGYVHVTANCSTDKLCQYFHFIWKPYKIRCDFTSSYPLCVYIVKFLFALCCSSSTIFIDRSVILRDDQQKLMEIKFYFRLSIFQERAEKILNNFHHF